MISLVVSRKKRNFGGKVKCFLKKKVMSAVVINNISVSLLEDAETIHNQMSIKQSLTQAFKELADAEQSGIELPNSRNGLK